MCHVRTHGGARVLLRVCMSDGRAGGGRLAARGLQIPIETPIRSHLANGTSGLSDSKLRQALPHMSAATLVWCKYEPSS